LYRRAAAKHDFVGYGDYLSTFALLDDLSIHMSAEFRANLVAMHLWMEDKDLTGGEQPIRSEERSVD